MTGSLPNAARAFSQSYFSANRVASPNCLKYAKRAAIDLTHVSSTSNSSFLSPSPSSEAFESGEKPAGIELSLDDTPPLIAPRDSPNEVPWGGSIGGKGSFPVDDKESAVSSTVGDPDTVIVLGSSIVAVDDSPIEEEEEGGGGAAMGVEEMTKAGIAEEFIIIVVSSSSSESEAVFFGKGRDTLCRPLGGGGCFGSTAFEGAATGPPDAATTGGVVGVDVFMLLATIVGKDDGIGVI